MNKLMISALALGLMVSGAAMANETAPASPGGKPAPTAEQKAEGAKKKAERFAASDADKDGTLSKQEFQDAHAKKSAEIFDKLDTNKDGKVGQDEMKAGHERMREKMKAHMNDKKPE